MTALNRNDVFSILVLSTKKRYSSFLEKVFIFHKILLRKIPQFHLLPGMEILLKGTVSTKFWENCQKLCRNFSVLQNFRTKWLGEITIFFAVSISNLRCWNRSKILMIPTYKHAYLSNGGPLWKSLLLLFRRIFALSVGFKTKSLRKSVFQC